MCRLDQDYLGVLDLVKTDYFLVLKTLLIVESALFAIEYSGILSDNEDFAKSCITRCVLERYLHTLDSCQSDNIHSAYTRLAGYITGYCVDIIPCTLRGSSTSALFQS